MWTISSFVAGQAIKAEGAEQRGEGSALLLCHHPNHLPNNEVGDVRMRTASSLWPNMPLDLGLWAGQAIKADGAEPEGQYLSPTPVVSSMSLAG